MAPQRTPPAHEGSTTKRWLQWIGTCGTILALVILGASMLLRLATMFGVDGQPISTLPGTLEKVIRLSHRLAAAGVGILAVCAVGLGWIHRRSSWRVGRPISLIVATTVALAIIGPLTPGYRLAGITVGNVAGGMILLMAFWWLRERVATHPAPYGPAESLIRATLFVFLVHVATGAAASAQEMHGIRWFAFLHLATALLAIMFIGAILWDRRGESLTIGRMTATAVLLAEVALGGGLMWFDDRPIWLAFSHGMLSTMLAMALVSMAIRGKPEA